MIEIAISLQQPPLTHSLSPAYLWYVDLYKLREPDE